MELHFKRHSSVTEYSSHFAFHTYIRCSSIREILSIFHLECSKSYYIEDTVEIKSEYDRGHASRVLLGAADKCPRVIRNGGT